MIAKKPGASMHATTCFVERRENKTTGPGTVDSFQSRNSKHPTYPIAVLLYAVSLAALLQRKGTILGLSTSTYVLPYLHGYYRTYHRCLISFTIPGLPGRLA